MAEIDAGKVERLFSTVAGRIFDDAEMTVTGLGMDKYINSGVLVGLSGGADSVMLLYFLLEYRRRYSLNFSILAVHINHGIRGEEADSDEEFCKSLCASLGVELEVRKIDVPFQAERFKMSIEETARYLRYYYFDRIISGSVLIICR